MDRSPATAVGTLGSTNGRRLDPDESMVDVRCSPVLVAPIAGDLPAVMHPHRSDAAYPGTMWRPRTPSAT